MSNFEERAKRPYLDMNKSELLLEKERITKEYNKFKSKRLLLDISRGKPCKEQLNLSVSMLTDTENLGDFLSDDKRDCGNYGVLDGISKMKQLFADILDVDKNNVFVCGNSSLNAMFDVMSHFVMKGVGGNPAWIKQDKVKFLCFCPGYDRHFTMLGYFGIEPVVVPLLKDGPDMDMVEKLVNCDESIKGMWCVPRYSNPTGIVYSDDTISRLAALHPAARDFRIFWDDAYAVHYLTNSPCEILNILSECRKNGNEDMVIMFTSTSKITFPGAGVSAFACSKRNLESLKERYACQTIGFDKINQLRHVCFLKSYDNVIKHMKKHREIIKPKFDCVLSIFDREFEFNPIITWTIPEGGYFISASVMDNCAKRVIKLCKEAGVIFTPAGSTYPNGIDPNDENIRIAPTFPAIEELKEAIKLFCICVKLASLEKLISSNDSNSF